MNVEFFLPMHNVYFVKYNVTVSFMAQVLDTVTYFVSHVLVANKLWQIYVQKDSIF